MTGKQHGETDNAEKYAEIRENVCSVLQPEAFDQWLHSPFAALRGRSPWRAMEDGDVDAVLEITRSYGDPSFT